MVYVNIPSGYSTGANGDGWVFFVQKFIVVFTVLWITAVFVFSFSSHPSQLRRVVGPRASSWLLGALRDVTNFRFGTAMALWRNLYGVTFSYPGPLGKARLCTTDLVALKHILFTNSYNYEKEAHVRRLLRGGMGLGLLTAEGEAHKRQRRVMLTPFSDENIRNVSVGIYSCSQLLAKLLAQHIDDESSHRRAVLGSGSANGQTPKSPLISTFDEPDCAQLNLFPILSRATLEIVGRTTFGVELGVLNQDTTSATGQLSSESRTANLDLTQIDFASAFDVISVDGLKSVMAVVWAILPVVTWFPTTRLHRLAVARHVVQEKLHELVQAKSDEVRARNKADGEREKKQDEKRKLKEEVKKEVAEKLQVPLTPMSPASPLTPASPASPLPEVNPTVLLDLLVHANLQRDVPVRERMTHTEVAEQCAVFAAAGYETTANSIAWATLHLARNQGVQKKLRQELKGRLKLGLAFDADIDLDIPYLSAFVKEVLRLSPPLPLLTRVAAKADVIPFSHPVALDDGTKLHALHIEQGEGIAVPLKVLNTSVDLWGPDAGELRPERWIEQPLPNSTNGLHGWAKLSTFGFGPRGCVASQLAVNEIALVVGTLVANFHIEPCAGTDLVVERTSVFCTPVLGGAEKNGPNLPILLRKV